MINPYEKDTDTDNIRYYTLKQACKSGSLSTVQSILQSKNSASPDLDRPEHLPQRLLKRCLFEAFTDSHFDVARYLIREAGAEIEPSFAWHTSTKPMSVKAFEFLVQEGWDINTPVYGARTALSLALTSLPLTKLLLEHGANPNLGPHPHRPHSKGAIVPNSGLVLNLAACVNPAIAVAVIDLLVQHGARLEDSLPLHLVAECGLYESSPQPTTSSATSHPPAQVGLDPDSTSMPSSSRIPVLQHLLNLGYDPNASDGKKFGPHALDPPLHWAVRWWQVENARFLLENGADPWGRDRHGRNALEAAEQERGPAGDHEIENVLKEFM